VQLGANLICLGGELLFFLDGLCGGVNLGGLDYVLRFPFGAFNLPLKVLLDGLGFYSGDYLVNRNGQSNP